MDNETLARLLDGVDLDLGPDPAPQAPADPEEGEEEDMPVDKKEFLKYMATAYDEAKEHYGSVRGFLGFIGNGNGFVAKARGLSNGQLVYWVEWFKQRTIAEDN